MGCPRNALETSFGTPRAPDLPLSTTAGLLARGGHPAGTRAFSPDWSPPLRQEAQSVPQNQHGKGGPHQGTWGH